MRARPLLFSLLFLSSLSAHGQAPPSPKVLERYKQMLTANPAEGTALDRLWKAYADLGQTGQLIEEYRADASFPAQMILGHLLRRAGRPDEAIAAYQKAAQLDAKNTLPLLALAKLESERGQPEDAAAHYEQAIALLPANDPKLPENLLALGAAWLEAGELEKASAAWEKTAALNPNDLALRRRLAETYERNFLPDRALTHLAYLETHAPPTERPLALQQIARIHQNAGRQDEAIAALDKALALTGPASWLRGELESQLIRLHQRYHRTDELEARWKKYAAENPRDLGACLQLIELYERLGNLEEQRTWLTKLTTLAPKNVEYRAQFARLLLQLEATDEAVKIYDQLLVEQPSNADFVFERARIDLQREAVPAAKQRIAALLTARKNDETVRAKALQFYEQHALNDLVEAHLKADAAAGTEEALTELAGFYFSHRREDEARATMQRLVLPTDPPTKQAAARLRVAQWLRVQNDLDHAAEELLAATRLDPVSREIHLTLGEIQATRGLHPAAQEELKKAYAASTTEVERADADQKLFESFRAQSATNNNTRPERTWLPPSTRVSDLMAPDVSPELQKFLAELDREALAVHTESSWLRLARWRQWNREDRAASIAAQRALVLNPNSVPAREMLVKIDSSNTASPTVTRQLEQLAKVDPANRVNYQRRAGQFELQAGRINEALAIFQSIATENPGNLDALSDLALAQQRAENWGEAAANWHQVYLLSPASRRKDTLVPLLRALERLGQYEESAAIQLQAAEAETTDREKLARFADLLTHCSRHGLLDWLRTEIEKRRKVRADDYFTEVAYGRILKAQGETAAAFNVLADASYSAPNQAAALPELIREAEELQKPEAAVKLQAQLLRIAPSESPDGFEKLAQLQEKNFEIEEAQKTWDRIVAKFPRDAAALNRAVDFQLAWGSPERALPLLRKARALEPGNVRTLTALASLDIEAGDVAEAEASLNELLRYTTPERSGDLVRFPGVKTTEPGRLQTAYLSAVGQRNGRPAVDVMRALRSFWIAETPAASASKGDRDTRLNAIRQLAQITQSKNDPSAVAVWIARWKKEKNSPSEALWALYHVGAGAETLDRVEEMMADDPADPKTAQAFIWLALQTHQSARLAVWLKDKARSQEQRDYVLIAVGQALDGSAGEIDAAMIDALFANGTHLRLWQGALLFATRNHYREAITLGSRVFESSTTQRASCGPEIAHWHLFLGEVEAARAILRKTIAVPADSLDSPVCVALREYYLLLPEKDRAAFADTYLQGLKERDQPLFTALATALLRGLAGREAEACAALDQVVAMRPLANAETADANSSGPRQLRFALETGKQLQAMKLESLAIYLWEKIMRDSAQMLLQGDNGGNIAREIRQSLYSLRAAVGGPGEFPLWVDKFGAVSPVEGLTQLSTMLANLGAHERAIGLQRQIWEHDPRDPDALRSLLATCRAAGDDDTIEDVLRDIVRASDDRLPDNARRDFALQLSEILERKGQLAQSCTLLEQALDNTPGDIRLLLRVGQLQERTERPEAAMSSYQRLLVFEPGNTTARIALSGLYEAKGRLPEALALFKPGAGSELDTRLAVLQLKNGHPEIALALLERIGSPHYVNAAISVASALSTSGDRRTARTVLQNALNRTSEAKLSFPLQCRIVELLNPEDGPANAAREIRRLRRFATAAEGSSLLDSYLDFSGPQATRLGIAAEFREDVRTIWAAGAGPLAAGVAQLTAQLDAGEREAAGKTCEQLLARSDAPAPVLQSVAEALEKAQWPALLARTQERLTVINPLDEQNALKLVQTWRTLGKIDEAKARLEALAMRATLNEDSLGNVAAAYVEFGDVERAKTLYAQALRNDRFARNWATLIDYARLQTKLGDFVEARRTLRRAFTHPANRRFDEIVEWLVASGRIEQHEAELAEFRLTPPRLAEVRRTISTYFEKIGQPKRGLSMFEAHPEIMSPALAGRVRLIAKASGEYARGLTFLETLAAQGSAPEYSVEWAHLQSDWAGAELAAGRADGALAHLRLAHERQPQLFDIATHLSALLNIRGDRRGAIETLESFMAVGKVQAEIEQARGMVIKLRTAG